MINLYCLLLLLLLLTIISNTVICHSPASEAKPSKKLANGTADRLKLPVSDKITLLQYNTATADGTGSGYGMTSNIRGKKVLQICNFIPVYHYFRWQRVKIKFRYWQNSKKIYLVLQFWLLLCHFMFVYYCSFYYYCFYYYSLSVVIILFFLVFNSRIRFNIIIQLIFKDVYKSKKSLLKVELNLSVLQDKDDKTILIKKKRKRYRRLRKEMKKIKSFLDANKGARKGLFS